MLTPRRVKEGTNDQVDKHIKLETDCPSSALGLGYTRKDDNEKKMLPAAYGVRKSGGKYGGSVEKL